MSSLVLTPAHGRDYTSQAAVLKDWNAGKDFEVADVGYRQAYINKEDADRFRISVRIRYAKLRKVMVVRPEEPGQ